MPEKNETAYTTAHVPFRTIAHLYDTDDPTPEDHRELSEQAEQKIFRQVLDRPAGMPRGLCSEIEISLPAGDLAPGRADAIIAAVRSHFRARSEEVRRDMRLIQQIGLREIRLTAAVCIPSFIGIAICSQFKGDPLVEVIENVLIIFCWVTIWQPFQSLVFDRWTLHERAKVYRLITDMKISVRPA